MVQIDGLNDGVKLARSTFKLILSLFYTNKSKKGLKTFALQMNSY